MIYHFNAKALHIKAVLVKLADNRHCAVAILFCYAVAELVHSFLAGKTCNLAD